jgi:hypothetical protein
MLPKLEINTKCTKWSQNIRKIIQNDHKMYQHFPILGPPKFTQKGILNNLATLFATG